MTLYRITDWDEHYESSKSRERGRCSWCPIPNKQDGLGYRRLIHQKNGTALYGAFIAVVLVASKQDKPRGGYLTGTGRADGVPYTPNDLSLMTGIPESVMGEMLTTISDVSIGWIESCGEVPAECPPSALEGKGKKRREEKGKEEKYREVAAVVAHYLEYHSKAKPGTKEEGLIRNRLKDGYTVNDLCQAIDGNHRDAYCCGENSGGKQFHTLELIFRDSSHVAKYMEVPAAGAPVVSEKERRSVRALDTWAQQELIGGGDDQKRIS